MNLRKLKRILRRLWRYCKPQCIVILIILVSLIALLVFSCTKDDPKETDTPPASTTPTATISPTPEPATPSPTMAEPSPTATPSVIYGSCDSTTTDVGATPIPMDDWEIDYLMLVNWNNRLKYSGNPEGLVLLTSILDSDEYIIQNPNTNMGNETALLALDQMCKDARAAGCSKVKISTTGAYRTYETQDGFWQNHLKEDPNYGADPYNDPPRTVPGNASEHRTGLGFDIWLLEYDYAWLHENCHRYGFILRYPANKVSYTGIIYEQWHYRYVGVDAATAMHDMGFCLEEYIAYLNGADITPYPTKPVTPKPTKAPTATPTQMPDISATPTPEITPDVTPEISPELTPELTPGVTPEISPDITPEISPDVTPEISPEITPETTPTPVPTLPPEPTHEPSPTPEPQEPTPEPSPTSEPQESPESIAQ